MPQLITLLYYHKYISVLLILMLSFLLFLKYFLPILVKLVKLFAKSSYEKLHKNLFYFVSHIFVKVHDDLYFISYIKSFVLLYTLIFQICCYIYCDFAIKNH